MRRSLIGILIIVAVSVTSGLPSVMAADSAYGGLMPSQGQPVGAKRSTDGKMVPLKVDGTGALVTSGGGGGGGTPIPDKTATCTLTVGSPNCDVDGTGYASLIYQMENVGGLCDCNDLGEGVDCPYIGTVTAADPAAIRSTASVDSQGYLWYRYTQASAQNKWMKILNAPGVTTRFQNNAITPGCTLTIYTRLSVYQTNQTDHIVRDGGVTGYNIEKGANISVGGFATVAGTDQTASLLVVPPSGESQSAGGGQSVYGSAAIGAVDYNGGSPIQVPNVGDDANRALRVNMVAGSVTVTPGVIPDATGTCVLTALAPTCDVPMSGRGTIAYFPSDQTGLCIDDGSTDYFRTDMLDPTDNNVGQVSGARSANGAENTGSGIQRIGNPTRRVSLAHPGTSKVQFGGNINTPGCEITIRWAASALVANRTNQTVNQDGEVDPDGSDYGSHVSVGGLGASNTHRIVSVVAPGEAGLGVSGGSVMVGALDSAGNTAIPSVGDATNSALRVSHTTSLPDSTTTYTLTGTDSITIPISGRGNGRVQISGAWTGTITFDATVDGTNWVPITGMPTPVQTNGARFTTSTTANGVWEFRVAGYAQLRLSSSAVVGNADTVTRLSTGTDFVAANVVGVNSISDPGNSVTCVASGPTCLLAGGTFTGTGIDTSGYAQISMSAASDVISATDGIEFQWSPDNVNWSTRGVSELPAARIGLNQATDLSQRTHDRYFRIRYTNGGTNQTWFTLLVRLHTYIPQGDTKGVDQVPKSGDDAILTKSVISGKTAAGGGAYVDVKVNPSGTLQVGGSNTLTDSYANPADAFNVGALGMAWDPLGGVWMRLHVEGTNFDAEPVKTSGVLSTEGYVKMFNGTTWDRLRGDATNGLLVNLGANNDVTLTSGTLTSITNAITVQQSTASNLKLELWGGAKGTTTAATATVTPAGTNNNGLDVIIRDSTGAEMDLFRANDLYTAAADHGLLILGQDAGAPARYRALKVDATGSVQVDVESGTITSITNPVTVTDGAGALNVIVDSGTVTATVSGTVTANQGTANTDANRWPVKITNGTLSADVESPNNDGDSGHDAMSTESYGMVYNGASWDRQRGNTTGTFQQGTAAEAAPATGNPLRNGAVVEVDAAAMTSTNQADQDITSLKADEEGRQYVRTDHPYAFSCNLSAASADSAICTDLTGVAGTVVFVTDIFVSNGATAGSIIINSGTGTACATAPTAIHPATYLSANSGFVYSPKQPIKITWASGLDICADITSLNPYSVSIRGYYFK